MAFSPESEDGIFDINITPFVDVVLVLLVIFMVTAPMLAKQALTLTLPDSSVSDPIQATSLGISISASGQFSMYGELTSEKAFVEKAAQAMQKDPNTQAMIAADVNCAHKHVIKVINLLRQAGVERYAFQVRVEE
ncbi:MAG: biopolymer transporter ExbD [Bdellovibrionales bacterium]|nr:biopolymer transporter ExbD [Bdellovibrionales bacterium]